MFDFKNTVIHFFGYPGVGKYTIAKEIAKSADFRLIDNHLINNPVFTVVGADGIKQLPPEIWSYCTKIRQVVFEAIEKLAEPDTNFIMTNYLTRDDEIDLSEKLDLFERRKSSYYPVFLHCNQKTHRDRMVSEDRRIRMKDINPDRDREELWIFNHPNRLEFDISSGTPEQAALDILTKISELQKGPNP